MSLRSDSKDKVKEQLYTYNSASSDEGKSSLFAKTSVTNKSIDNSLSPTLKRTVTLGTKHIGTKVQK